MLGDVLLAVAFFCTFLGIALYFAVQTVRGDRRRRERIFVLDHFTPSYPALATTLSDDARDDSDTLLTIVWRTKSTGTFRRMLDHITVGIGLGFFVLLALTFPGVAFAWLRSATPAGSGNLWQPILATAFLVPGSVLVMYRTLMDRLYKPIAISATTSGLRWQPFWGRSRFMAWTEMRLLETAQNYGGGSVPHYHGSFTLYSRDAAIRWNDDSTGRSAYAQLEELLTLIHDRTGLQPQHFTGTAAELHDIETSPLGSPIRQPGEMAPFMVDTFTGRIKQLAGASWDTIGILAGLVVYNVLTIILAVLYPPTTVPLYNLLIVISLVPFTIVMAYRGVAYLKRPLLHAGMPLAVTDATDAEDAGDKSPEVRVLGYRAPWVSASGGLVLGILLLVDAPPPLDAWLFRSRYPGSTSVFVPGGNHRIVAYLLFLSVFTAVVLILTAIVIIISRSVIVVLAVGRGLIATMPLAETAIPWESVSSITARRWLGRIRWYVVTASAAHIRWPAGGNLLPRHRPKMGFCPSQPISLRSTLVNGPDCRYSPAAYSDGQRRSANSTRSL